MMDIFWDNSAWEDYLYWQGNDRNVLLKINALIKECQRTPFEGTGKPEPLRQNLSGFWSRRINSEHRLVYKVEDNTLYIAQCRYHY
ncbi:MAG TPA: Txe/YoeB family addiction module toxin [Prolixibacteraceae bacterium]|jgi:toxin YoeB|nr:Txe/YoeB family addiction module toxin [Prolixibacteraceae bacterium]HOY51151.1 Txe/YoeB family addiction module toxin [Prolixibacteraceae bacterium]HRV90122.1 Txe/YoeB family addiction module toxin [Prolixibacteraceae bacterium]